MAFFVGDVLQSQVPQVHYLSRFSRQILHFSRVIIGGGIQFFQKSKLCVGPCILQGVYGTLIRLEELYGGSNHEERVSQANRLGIGTASK